MVTACVQIKLENVVRSEKSAYILRSTGQVFVWLFPLACSCPLFFIPSLARMSECDTINDIHKLYMFKLCTLVFRCLHGLAPRYLSDLCTPATVHTHLRSSVTLERSLLVPRTKTKTIGPRGFYFASSAAWNALPVHLRDPGLSLNNFKIKLKTHFFSWSPPPGDHVFCVRRARQRDNS